MSHESRNSRPTNEDDELLQTLLELHYGLLEDDEAAELRDRIATEPAVARLWADTLIVAGKFAEAAKVKPISRSPISRSPISQATISQVPLLANDAGRPRDTVSETDERADQLGDRQQVKADTAASPPTDTSDNNTVSAADSDSAAAMHSDRFIRLWLGSLATAAAFAIAISGLRYWNQLPELPDQTLRVAVQPVAGADVDARNEFLVAVGPQPNGPAIRDTFDTSMPVVPATISFKVLSKGAVLFFGTSQTTDSGPCRIRVPDDIVIPGDAKLHVDAIPTGGAGLIRLTVPLEPTRCLTFVSTDRPVYRPGETVFFRSVTLNRRTLASHVDVPIRYELTGANGATIEGAVLEGVTERGVGNGAFVIPESASGGNYQLIAKSLDGFFPDQICDLEVRPYRAVRLKTNLEFSKRSFSAGDRVEASCSVRRADDSIPAGASTRVNAVVDGNVIHQSAGTIGVDGELSIAFELPKVIHDGEGTLGITIDDGSITETVARPIPIHTGRADVDFYPEGGYLIGGVPNRVYFAAHDPDGKPIEISGEVLSQAGRVVATVQTVRDGMGRFEFKPESGQRYSLRVTSPLDITETPWLPSVVEALPVLDTGAGVFEPEEPITMTIRSTKRRPCLVRVVCRGELVGVKSTEIGLGDTAISVPIQDRAAGVIRITVLDASGKTATPLVERLVYRKGEKKLNVATTVDTGRVAHAPGESVRMTIAVTDELDQPVPGAVLGVSVVDDAALSLRQHDLPSMKTHFMLTSEIESPEDLEHANFYLSDSPEAAESLDLLLGTQGWRRFVGRTPGEADETFRDALTRLLELDGRPETLVADTQTNDIAISDQLHAYAMGAASAWQNFVTEVRTALLLIASFWLFGLLVRPRKSATIAAGLLLVIVVWGLQPGCGGNHEAYVVGSGEESESSAETQASGVEAPMMENPSLSSDVNAIPRPREVVPNATGSDKPFVERVVRVFLGQRGGKPAIEDLAATQISPQQLERWARSRDLDAHALADQLMEELRFPIRQYAHVNRVAQDGARNDFAETLLWNPMMVTDSTGTASIQFDLSDSLTMFRVRVDAHSRDGRLGSGEGSVLTKIPIEVEPKMPLEVTSGDRIDLPVGLVNATDHEATMDVNLQLGRPLSATRTTAVTTVAAGGRTSKRFPIQIDLVNQPIDAKVRVSASLVDHSLSDLVERSVRVVPDGFPFEITQSGSLSRTSVSFAARLPEQLVAGSLSARLEVFPSASSQLSAGLESILREPHGCFEQASASNYPNVMAYQLLLLEGVADDPTQRRTVSLLRRGYRKLTSYECSTLGYEWFGNDPGHEALSAFGLMQFSEMAKIIDVDPEMLARTRQWLLSRRDGKGGFQRNPRHLHAWSVQQDLINAYLLWAISQSDMATGELDRMERELSPELEAMQSIANDSTDPYLMALSAITLGNVGRKDAMQSLLDRLAATQQSDGHFDGSTTITQSGGISREVETTSLAILAFCQSETHPSIAQSATAWLIDHRQGGGFGSTQATVLALKALIAMHNQITAGNGGSVDVMLGDEVVQTIGWNGSPAEGVTWDLNARLIEEITSNPNASLTLRTRDQATIPYSIVYRGQTTSPQSDPDCPIALKLSFNDKTRQATIRSGDTVEVIAEIANTTDVGHPMTVAVVGLPGGLEPVIESLDKLRDTGSVDYYELRGREVILYWRSFAPDQVLRVPITCVAAVGGKYTGPPSRAYLYYTAESKTWHKPLVAEIN